MERLEDKAGESVSVGALIGASACLAGLPCRYDGKSRPHAGVEELHRQGKVVLVCPEQLGGLPTPRVPSGISGGGGEEVWQGQAKVVSRAGCDVTQEYCRGAELALAKLRQRGVTRVVLKQHSPSCGFGSTGSAAGTRIAANGVFTALCLAQGISVCSDEDFAL